MVSVSGGPVACGELSAMAKNPGPRKADMLLSGVERQHGENETGCSKAATDSPEDRGGPALHYWIERTISCVDHACGHGEATWTQPLIQILDAFNHAGNVSFAGRFTILQNLLRECRGNSVAG